MNSLSEKQTIYKASGFTIIEVLIVMAVIAVLYGVVFPIGKRVIARAHITADKTKLQMLVFSYNRLRDNGCLGFGVRIGDIILGLVGEGIDDTSWYHSSAKLGRKVQKLVDDNGKITTKRIVSDWVMVYNLPPDAPENAPVFYLNGLKSDGTWSSKSAYGGRVGLIAFLSGEVRAVKNANEVLTSRQTGQPTGNIYEALPQGAVITNVFAVP